MMDWIINMFFWLFSDGTFLKFFREQLRSDFFNGFLSLAGFMLAAKTFIVIHMKQEVFDKPEYAEKFDKRKEVAGEKGAKRYGPLENMSNALFWITISSVTAAVCQITVGLIPFNIAACLCILSVTFAMFKLIIGLKLIKANLDSWFEIVHEKEAKREADMIKSHIEQ